MVSDDEVLMGDAAFDAMEMVGSWSWFVVC